MKKRLSVLLCLCLLLSCLAGCAAQDKISDDISNLPAATHEPTQETTREPKPVPTPEPTPEPETAPVGSGYFAENWRGDVDFSELEFELYDMEWLKEYTDPLYDIAENGGTAEEFEDAHYWLTD